MIKAVGFARSQGLLVAVRGGSHSIAGFSTVDGGVVIDLTVDPQRRGRPRWRRHGLTCDSLVAADVVTADGQLVHADAEENADLFWALRGGGGNFGVVTSMEFTLHPVGPMVLGGLLFFPGEAAKQVVTGWRNLTASMPDELSTALVLTTAPPVPFLPEAVHGQPVAVIAGMHCGPLDRAEEAVSPLRTLAEPILDHFGPVPYVVMQQALDPLWTAGAYNYFTSAMLDELSDAAIDELLDGWSSKPTPQSELHVHHAGGAMARVPGSQTAFSQRTSPFILNVIARAVDHVGFDGHVSWARDTRTALAGYGPGSMYVNFTGDAGEDKVRASYPAETYAKLVAVKDRYDPTNVFRLNQNIPPSDWSAPPS